jgi:flagellar assembly protein FliH
MTNSSDPSGAGPKKPQPSSNAGNSGSNYSRFIPREELGHFAAWEPNALTGQRGNPAFSKNDAGDHAQTDASSMLRPKRPQAASKAPPAPPPPSVEEQIKNAHTKGYQDGYRDGLAALEAFKQQWASQTSTQMQGVIEGLQQQFDNLEHLLAQKMAEVAVTLARQVVRTEIAQRHEIIAQVAQEALSTLMTSARHIVVRVNPVDMALVTAGATDILNSRQAHLISDDHIERGGCLIESDLGVIDARIEQRWQQAVESMGQHIDWKDDDAAAAAPGEMAPLPG